MKVKLVPQPFDWTDRNGERRRSLEKIMLVTQGYPETLIHIDNFYGLKFYDKLDAGETVEVEMTFTELEA